MTTEQALISVNERFPNDKMYKTMTAGNLTMPEFVSGNRSNMFSTHITHAVPIENPESPNFSTSFEKPYGEYTDSYAVAQADFKVIAVIPKFINISRFNYIYVVQNMLTKVYDVIEMKHYECLSEERGYLRPYTREGDMFKSGDIIKKGTTLFHSNNHDEYGNYRYGVNAKCAYISIPETEEDGIVISESFRERLAFYDMVKTPITLNKNQMLLNLYGDKNNYKCFPDIGEEVKNGMLFARRSINYSNIAAECTDAELCHILTSDEVCHGGGVVGDIDIWINDPEEFQDSGNKQQIYKYYQMLMEYYTKVYNVLSPIVTAKQKAGVQYTYKLRWTFEHAKNYLDKKDLIWANNNNSIEFAYIEIFTYERKIVTNGYKITDRFGSKGVITHVWPDEYMPRDEYGNVSDMIISPPGTIARANQGQNYEQEYNFIAAEVFKKILKMPYPQRINATIEFFDMAFPDEGNSLKKFFNRASQIKIQNFFDDIEKFGPILIKKPFNGEVTPERLEALYKKYNVYPSHVFICREFDDNLTALSLENTGKALVSKSSDGREYVGPTTKSMNEEVMYGVSPFDVVKGSKYAKPKTEMGIMPIGNGEYESVNLFTYTSNVNSKEKSTLPGNCVRAWINDKGKLVRQYKSENPVIIGKKYYILLKQMPDEKFSARSVGSTNQVGIPNKAGKQIKLMSPYARNAIRMGEMENDVNFVRIDPEIENRLMATHSTNPELCEKLATMLLTENPFELHDLPIKDEDIKDNVPALMLHSILYSMCGVEIGDICERE